MKLNQNSALKSTRIEYLEESVDELGDTIQEKESIIANKNSIILELKKQLGKNGHNHKPFA
jgi:hypothetical protein